MPNHRHTPLEYLSVTRIGEKGQLTVPQQFRRDLGLRAGAPFAVLRLGDGLILWPQQQRFEQLCQQVSARLTAAGLTRQQMLATLSTARQRVYERHYGGKSPSEGARRGTGNPRRK